MQKDYLELFRSNFPSDSELAILQFFHQHLLRQACECPAPSHLAVWTLLWWQPGPIQPSKVHRPVCPSASRQAHISGDSLGRLGTFSLNGKIIMMMARFMQVSQALCIVDSTCPSVREGGTQPQWHPCFSDDGSEAAQVLIAGQH